MGIWCSLNNGHIYEGISGSKPPQRMLQSPWTPPLAPPLRSRGKSPLPSACHLHQATSSGRRWFPPATPCRSQLGVASACNGWKLLPTGFSMEQLGKVISAFCMPTACPCSSAAGGGEGATATMALGGYCLQSHHGSPCPPTKILDMPLV